MKTKNQKRKLKSRYKKYVAGGMYADNTVSAAGQGMPGSTANIVFDQSNPKILTENLNYLDKIKNQISSENDNIVSELKQEDEQSKIDIEQASLESQQQTDAIGSTIGASLEAGKQTGLIDKKAGSLGIGQAIDAYKNVRHAKKVVKGVEGFNQAKTAFDVGQRAKQGEDAYKLAQSMKNVKDVTDAGLQTSSSLGQGLTLGKTTGSAFGTGTTLGGTTLKGAELGAQLTKDGTMVASEGAKQAASGSAIGAGLGSLAKNPNVYALAAQYGGKAIRKKYDDNDATTWTRGEATGDILGTAGEYASYGAMAGSVVPGVGNLAGAIVGGIVGAGVGTYKGLTGRGEARRVKDINTTNKLHKVNKYNAEITSDLLAAKTQARTGEMEQKTYSGYDLGKNVVAKYGGMRYEHGGLSEVQMPMGQQEMQQTHQMPDGTIMPGATHGEAMGLPQPMYQRGGMRMGMPRYGYAA